MFSLRIGFISICVMLTIVLPSELVAQSDWEDVCIEPYLGISDSLLVHLDGFGYGCSATTTQLRLLGPSNLQFIRDVIDLGDEFRTRFAFKALANIGNEGAMVILRESLADTSASLGTRIMAGEALGDARDFPSIPLMEALVANSESAWFRQYVSRAVERIIDPSIDAPILDLYRKRVWLRFLNDDIKRVAILNGKGGAEKHIFSEEQIPIVLRMLTGELLDEDPPTLLRLSAPTLEIELKDGRTAILTIDENNFSYAVENYWTGRYRFTAINPELRVYIDAVVNGVADPNAAPSDTTMDGR